MELALKQRLVGASVIIALVVIFVPMVFDDGISNRNQTISIEIPGEPEDLKHKVISIDSKTTLAEKDNPVDTVRKEPIKRHETIIDVVDNSVSRNKDKVVEKKQADNIVPVTKPSHDKQSDSKEMEAVDPKKNKTVSKDPLPKERGSGKAYRVKLGSFSQQKNAQQLKARIINTGLKAIVEKDKSKNLYMVYSQQFKLLVDAEKLSKKLQQHNFNIGKPSIEVLNLESMQAAEIQLDTGWIVQIGSFSNQTNSMKLRDKIRDKGFVTFVDEIINSKKQILYRVRIGPYATREEAQVEKNNIKKKMSLDGLLKPHEKQKVIR
ncbi:MAG: SPOR domain-containing protein [Alcanivoracaceae bacterium]|nr:SPOR domain-containing protein [Alcanivoracaceae bacterium]